jgi:hypothetical protein
MGVNASCPFLSFASDLTRVVGQASNATVLVRQSQDIYVRSDTGGSAARESCIRAVPMQETMCEVQESHLSKNLYVETILHNGEFLSTINTRLILYYLSFSHQFLSLISQPPILP